MPDGADTALLNLTGRRLDQGAGDARYQSLVSVLELHDQSPQMERCGPNVTECCAFNDTATGGDIRFVGALTTAPQRKLDGTPGESLVAFGIATWSNWANLGNNTVPFVHIAVNRDGTADFGTYVEKPEDTDVPLATTFDLQTGAAVESRLVNDLFADVDTNVFDSNVIVLPVMLSRLGIDPTLPSARFSHWVGVDGYYGRFDGLVDYVPPGDGWMTFDPLKPGLWLEGQAGRTITQPAQPGTPIVVHRDAAALALDGSVGALVLSLHNPSGRRASVAALASELTIADASVTEGDSGMKLATFTINPRGKHNGLFVGQVGHRGRVAIAGSDYVTVPLTIISFGPGEKTKTVSVTVKGDTAVEPDEDLRRARQWQRGQRPSKSRRWPVMS